MTDRFDRQTRSLMMAAVRSKNTSPELAVRKLLSVLGFRYRLHYAGLPGKPDIVFVRMRKVIFVHGCFWHRHSGCALASVPQSRTEFWKRKFEANVSRDDRTLGELEAAGWHALVVWQCELKNIAGVAERLKSFLL